MPIEARVCRESGRELIDPNEIYAVLAFATGRVAVIDQATLRGIPEQDRDFEGPFSEHDEGFLAPDKIGVNVHHTIPSGQAGVVEIDDFLFAMWPDKLRDNLPNIAASLGMEQPID
jgi:hypothetical protein